MNFKYTEIMDYIKSEIAKGTYKSKLPSIRGMAIRFSCSNSTVIKAYSELEDQGIIYSFPKSGYYINQNRKDSGREFDFFSGIPLSSYLPFDAMEEAYASSFKENNISIINYSYSRGYEKLRELLADTFGLGLDPSRVFILSGTQNFFNLMVAMILKKDQEMLVEDPTYNLLVGALNAYGKKLQAVPRTLQGLDLDALEQKAKHGEFRYFYTMSRNHNPLGTSLTKSERKRLLALARQYDFYILEDDYIKELSEEPCLFEEDPDRVIYLRSFSKTISPSLRLCSLTVPEALKEDVSRTNSYMNTGASLISQDVLYRYLTSDQYHKNTRMLQERIQEKCAVLKRCLSDCPYPYYVPDMGLYGYIELPPGFRTMELLETLDAKGLRFRSDVEFSVTRTVGGLRISLSRVENKAIEKGIAELLLEMNRVVLEKKEPKDIYI
ncbi:Transcriptional regulator, GntR family domain / Aspartate aminotransferase [Clostridiaceae bacterium JG1575]|nr:Transcriptional regulator, GntR family domain / Aspartate aminotransferase [Clostridiaceae bacterium JG1575]